MQFLIVGITLLHNFWVLAGVKWGAGAKHVWMIKEKGLEKSCIRGKHLVLGSPKHSSRNLCSFIGN